MINVAKIIMLGQSIHKNVLKVTYQDFKIVNTVKIM